MGVKWHLHPPAGRRPLVVEVEVDLRRRWYSWVQELVSHLVLTSSGLDVRTQGELDDERRGDGVAVDELRLDQEAFPESKSSQDTRDNQPSYSECRARGDGEERQTYTRASS
jgi:hypothetical protein